jgi:hypothetical protein
MKKSRSSYDLDLRSKNPMKYQSSADLVKSGGDVNGKHKVVIYFSDAYNNICSKANAPPATSDDISIDHANRAVAGGGSKDGKDFMAQLKTVLEEKSKFTNKFTDSNDAAACPSNIPLQNKFLTKPAVPAKPGNMRVHINQLPPQPSSSNGQQQQQQQEINEKSSKLLLPSFIESIDENNVIKLKIEQNFKRASELVSMISAAGAPMKKRPARKCDASNKTSSIHELSFSHEDEIDDGDEIYSNDDNDDIVSEPDEGYFYDWSFVQEWRSR